MSEETNATSANADDPVALARAGDCDAIVRKYRDEAMVSIECGDRPMAVIAGIEDVWCRMRPAPPGGSPPNRLPPAAGVRAV
jgi:hypothetical protein